MGHVVCASWEEDSLEQFESSPEEAGEDHSVVVRRDDGPGGARTDFARRSQRVALVEDPFEEPMEDPFEEPVDDLTEMEEDPESGVPDADSMPDARPIEEAIERELQRRDDLGDPEQPVDTNPADPFVEDQPPEEGDMGDSEIQIVEPDDLGPPQDPTASPRTPSTFEPDTSGRPGVEAPSDFEPDMEESYDTESGNTGSDDPDSSNAWDTNTGENVDQSADDLDPQDRLLAEELAENTKNCEEEIAVLKSARIDSIDLNIHVRGNPGEDYPFECNLGTETFRQRMWPQITYMWKASGLCHKPLYFEQVHLERYRHSWGPYLQPIFSGAHFFATVPILPYKMGLKTPNECIYTLGYYRPGSCAPAMIEPIGFTWRAALFEAGTVVGAAAAIP